MDQGGDAPAGLLQDQGGDQGEAREELPPTWPEANELANLFLLFCIYCIGGSQRIQRSGDHVVTPQGKKKNQKNIYLIKKDYV